LEMGYSFGGGLGIQVSRVMTLRASYTYGNAQTNPDSISPLASTDFERHYYGADLQFRAANDSGFMPYLFIGGGAVTVSPDTSDVISGPGGVVFTNESFTKPAGRGGLGFEFQVPNSGFGVFAEGAGWVYEFDRFGFDQTQFDINWGGGITYRFGY
jgi:opacity protein-like surface antigen